MRMGKLVIAAAAATVVFAAGSAMAADGAAIFKQCAACHDLKADGKNKVGPNLFGIVGKKSGQAAGFAYSQTMKNLNITWDEANIDKYLTDVKAMVPNGKMAFAGLKNPDDRKAVIEHLKAAK